MYMTGQKLHLQFLQGRSGGATEPVRVEDERVENENQDDGGGPDKEMVETGGGGGATSLNSVMVMVIVGGVRGGRR